MGGAQGHIELDRAVSSIQVGIRHRADLGDVDALGASIERDGLLQPITVTPDGVLVCGARRLAAIKNLGWTTVKVWVRSGISGQLAHLLAEQDDNVFHKPLTQLENASLYSEIKKVMAEDAARRQEATRFSSEHQPSNDGTANFARPSSLVGEARKQAATMIPGGASHTTLEKITWLQKMAVDFSQPELVRAQAAGELELIQAGGPVHPTYTRMRNFTNAIVTNRVNDIARLSEEALTRAKGTQKLSKNQHRPTVRTERVTPERWRPSAFSRTWREFNGWWAHFEPAELAEQLSDAEIKEFLSVVDEAIRFADLIRAAVKESTVTDSELSDQGPKLRLL
ncbi:ParB N-terminal domain-containing protein [Arthrobacter sp. TB 23]|uniref:ParB N-terminal domain-containing protein n=1 Tax=Arthrobacter sp. TB 23 TaxID=494419 RepID=UPI0002DA71CE|nr:ParB N-terminal domain-containing protein [Arthrobacter sp. TB 23]